MNTRQGEFDAIAALVAYPGDGHVSLCATAADLMPNAPSLRAFLERTASLGEGALQELWTSTFDLKPVCSLDLGWHLFGENYDRGLMLVRMRAELARHGIQETPELPDHLSHALRLLGRMSPSEADDFAGACVMPALSKILTALPADNVFYSLVAAAREVLVAHWPSTADCLVAGPVFNIIREGALV